MKRCSNIGWVIFAAVTFCFSQASCSAGIVTLIPPNDPNGAIQNPNTNNGYSGGRGVVFSVSEQVNISQVGLYHDLTSTNIRFKLSQIFSTTGLVNDFHVVHRDGQRTVSTSGFEWIDFTFTPLTLGSGQSFHLEFLHEGNANQHLLYNNLNVAFSLPPYTGIEGSQGGFSGIGSNVYMPLIRILDDRQDTDSNVPEPSTIAIALALGIMMLGGRKRRGYPDRPSSNQFSALLVNRT